MDGLAPGEHLHTLLDASRSAAGAASVRFKVDDPDEWEREARRSGVTVLWPAQEATWGRFVVVADPDGRPVALAKMFAR